MADLLKRAWPADHVERRPLSSLIAYARNAREHSPEQIAQLAASMQEWGWTNPTLVDENSVLIAGHGRVLAAQKLGWTEAPVMVARGWTKAQIAAYRIADNKLALTASWSPELLQIELADLKEFGFDLALTGFGDDELADIFSTAHEGLTDPDEAPEPPTQPVSVFGDVWLLGAHRLVCGDSTDAGTVERVLAGVKPHLLVSDPPYGVEYNAAWRNAAGASINGTTQRVTSGKVIRRNNTRAIGKVTNDERSDWSEAWALFPGDVAYVWHGSLHTAGVLSNLESVGLVGRSLIIWVKQQFVISRGHYHNQHEPLWYAVRKGATGHWVGGHTQTTIWQIDKPRKSETGHSTQKPVECMRRPIENNSSPGQAVYDPFLGSGTTVIAAEMTGRSCHAIELDPAYCDVATRRWQSFTGKDATHAETGRTFAEMAADRGVVLPA